MNTVLYRHRQNAGVILVALSLAIAICGYIFFQQPTVGVGIIVGSVTAVLLLCLLIFGALSVEVTHQEVTVWFGPGWIKRRFSIDSICTADSVRNAWYYGWGMRLTPHGWLFNVSGLAAVELAFQDGHKFRIGTDEPEQLQAAIKRAISTEK